MCTQTEWNSLYENILELRFFGTWKEGDKKTGLGRRSRDDETESRYRSIYPTDINKMKIVFYSEGLEYAFAMCDSIKECLAYLQMIVKATPQRVFPKPG